MNPNSENSSGRKEDPLDFVVTLWRAIPGPNVGGKGVDLFRGVPVENRGDRGFFTENYSYAQSGVRPHEKGKGRFLTREDFDVPEPSFLDQYHKIFESRDEAEAEHPYKAFKGLPVFLNKSEASMWLASSKFQNPPLLGRLDVPFSLIDPDNVDRKALLSKNYADPGSNTLLGRTELQDFLSGKKKIQGELSLIDSRGEALDESLFRTFEKLYTVEDFQQDLAVGSHPSFVEVNVRARE
jgi:hypothetical protein